MKGQQLLKQRTVLTATMVCALLAGCSSANKINAPFTNNECSGKNLEEITAQLEAAGFKNIQIEPQDTTVEFNADEVISVRIGNNTAWNEANAWEPGTAVIVKYYNYTGIRHITVTADITVSGENGKPVFTIDTNLPNGTVLNTELVYAGTLTDGQEDYDETQDITVQGGVAQTEAYTLNGEELAGDYQFYVSMLPADQTDDVQAVTGTSGEALKGNLVEKVGEYQYIQTSIEYQSPIEEQNLEIEKIDEEELESRFREALAGFGDNCNITCEGYLYTVQVWQDGLAQTAARAVSGDKQAEDAWDKVVNVTLQATDSLQELLELSGYDEYIVQVQVLNDQNLANTLLDICLGMTTYNCVTAS